MLILHRKTRSGTNPALVVRVIFTGNILTIPGQPVTSARSRQKAATLFLL